VDSVGGRASSAASFLRAFVGETPWAHLDIAGTAWDCKAVGFNSAGATGFGVRLLTQACLEYKGI